jgi:hypothetical protein
MVLYHFCPSATDLTLQAEVTIPAVKGIKSILESAKKAGYVLMISCSMTDTNDLSK